MKHGTDSTSTIEDEQMTDLTYGAAEEPWATPADEEFAGLGRRRPRFLTKTSALLFAVTLGFVGFYAGIRVEKAHTTASTGSGLAAASRGATATGTRPSFGAGAPAGAGGAGGAGGLGGGSTGTVTSVDGNTIYVKESSGDTVKVKLSPATTLTKTVSVGKRAVDPGDAVVITGSSGSGGTIHATAVTDSGSSSSSAATSSSSSSS